MRLIKGRDDMNGDTTLGFCTTAAVERHAARLRYLPIAAFAVVAISLGWALNRDRTYDPREPRSAHSAHPHNLVLRLVRRYFAF
jgi:hypothetical protein